MKKIITSLLGVYINVLALIAPKKAGKFGFMLFCRPLRVPVTDYHKNFLHSADRFSFEHAGTNIQAYRWGHGPKKILFLHGWQSHSFRWKAYIDALDKEEHSIYAFDAPGHGLSGGNYLNVPYYGEIIFQLIETIGEVHTLVGHSLGSFSSLYMLHQKPSLNVKQLVLMAPPGEASDFIAFYRQTLGLSDRSMKLINEQFTTQFQKPITWFSTTAFASKVSVPGIIIHDEGDPEAPYHYAKKINSVWPKSHLITTTGLGHNLKSKDIVQTVTSFIKNEAPMGVSDKEQNKPAELIL
jgi:pimeloyl-ACP methyl ester carboxylesterase